MRSTPGIVAMGSVRSVPSITKIGQIKFEALSWVSCTIARTQSQRRIRRKRV